MATPTLAPARRWPLLLPDGSLNDAWLREQFGEQDRETVAAAHQLAVWHRERFGLTGPAGLADVQRVVDAWSYGLEVQYRADTVGCLVLRRHMGERRNLVLLPTGRPDGETAHLLAHELAHHLFTEDAPADGPLVRNYDPAHLCVDEVACETFARTLLGELPEGGR